MQLLWSGAGRTEHVRREITPSLYLLHARPLLSSTPHPLRLECFAFDLSRCRRKALDNEGQELIASVLALGRSS